MEIEQPSPIGSPTPATRSAGWVVRHRILARALGRGAVGTDGSAVDATAPELVTVVAPSGYGKSTLVEQLAGQVRHALVVDAGASEDHPGLLVDALVRAVRRAWPGADATTLWRLKSGDEPMTWASRVPYALSRVVADARRPGDDQPVWLILEELHRLRADGPTARIIAHLARLAGRGFRVVLTSETALGSMAAATEEPDPAPTLALTGQDLTFDVDETVELLRCHRDGPAASSPTDPQGDGELRKSAAAVLAQTGGWPGVVALWAVAEGGRVALKSLDGGLAAGDRGAAASLVEALVERLLDGLAAPARYFVRVVSVLGDIERERIQALFTPRADGGRRAWSDARVFIDLPRKEFDGYLEQLQARQLLRPARDSSVGVLAMNPLVRECLLEQLERDSPPVFREAHRRMAAWWLQREDAPSAANMAVAVDHLVAARDFDRVLELIEPDAERWFRSGHHQQLSRWLMALEGHFATLPFWAGYYLGRVYATVGDWERARGYLDHCKSLLGSIELKPTLWRWQPRVCLGYASMHRRRGMASEASTYCRRGLDFLRQAGRQGRVPEAATAEAVDLQLELLDLLGLLKRESGSIDKAREVFAEARELARQHGLGRGEAKALYQLGRVARLGGEVASALACFEEGMRRLEAVGPVDLSVGAGRAGHAVGLEADLGASLVAAEVEAGRWRSARVRIGGALAEAEATGHPATVARWRLLEGRLADATGDAEAANRAWRAASRTAELADDRALAVEVLDGYAAHLAAAGRVEEARLVARQGEAKRGGRRRAEAAAAAAQRAAIEARLALAAGELTLASERADEAADAFDALQSRYEFAQTSWLAARIAEAAFAAGDEESPDRAMTALEDACEEALELGFVLESEVTALTLLGAAAVHGGESTQRYLSDAAARHALIADAIEAGLAGLPRKTALAYRAYERANERRDAYQVTRRHGAEGLDDAGLATVVSDEGARGLVLLMHEQSLINHGTHISLAEKRVILPLLHHFLMHPDRDFTMPELAADVWGSGDATSSMQTKVKVAVSRLRALIGKQHSVVLTVRRPLDEGGSVVAYMLAPDVRFAVVELAQHDDGLDDLGDLDPEDV